jgi:hypothetical protein
MGAGIVVRMQADQYLGEGQSTQMYNQTWYQYDFISISDFFGGAGGSQTLGLTFLNSDGSAFAAPPAVKSYSHPTVFADTLLIFSPSGEQLFFNSGSLYADGTAVETYAPMDATGPDSRTVHIYRFQGPTPSNNASLVMQLGDGGRTARINLDNWTTDSGVFTYPDASSPNGNLSFYKNYPF